MQNGATIEATTVEECGACKQAFPTLAEVFSHPCSAVAIRHHDIPATNRADNVDAPERNGNGEGQGSVHKQDRANRYPGDCVRCGHRVEADQGLLVKDHAGSPGGRRIWGVEHRPGDCPDTAPEQPGDSAGVEAEIRAAGLRPNRYAGNCTRCGARIEAGGGVCEKQDGRWTVTHLQDSDCTTTQAALEETPATAELYPGYWLHPDSERVAEVIKSKQDRLYAKQLDADSGRFEYSSGLIREIQAGGWQPLSVEAAAALGRRFGRCMVCGRHLTNETSVEAGIGPICAGRLG